MILRERQKTFVERSVKALEEHGNTLGVAPTGSGKTIMLSAVVGRILNGDGTRAAVLAHRDEITAQNIDKFLKINPGMPVSVVDAADKSWSGKTTFAMVQTLTRARNLDQMPSLDLLVIDEAHHARADSYLRIIEAAKTRNPSIKIYGVTATPNRGDGKSLREVFSNCCDQITLGEMIASGQLVKPRTFVIDLGIQEELKGVRKIASEYDMDEVAMIMDRHPLIEAIIRHWKEKAGDRQTVVFCSTISHAEHVLTAYQGVGTTAELVTGDTPDGERAGIFQRLEDGKTQVLVNVAVATEGWDCPPVSCVVLLRPCSHKSTMIQMIGRGLRKLDPDRYPGRVKTDCLVLDFGISALTHGSLEQDVRLDPDREGVGQAPTKTCPKCKAEVPIRLMECPFCEHKFVAARQEQELREFDMTEIDLLLQRSPFKWCEIAGDGSMVIAAGFSAWGGIFRQGDRWVSIGGAKDSPVRILHIGDRTSSLASSNDWLNINETENAAHKTRRWLQEPATDKQIQYLPGALRGRYLTRYEACCHLTHRFNRSKIDQALAKARGPAAGVAA